MQKTPAWRYGQARLMGALTSRPYAFTARPWELRRTDTVDVFDGMGASVQVHTKGDELMRVQPRENDAINEEWLTDKSRYALDGFKRQRLTRPLVRGDGSWEETASSWRGAFETIRKAFDRKGGDVNLRAVLGSTTSLNTALAFSDWAAGVSDVQVESLGSSGGLFGADIPSQYRFNSTIWGVEESDLVVIVGCHLETEAPLVQTRLRKAFLDDTMDVVTVGLPVNVSFPTEHAGLTPQVLLDMAAGNHPLCERIAAASKPALIVGSQVMDREDGTALAAALETIVANNANLRQVDKKSGEVTWNGFNVVHPTCNDVGLLDLGRTVPFDTSKDASADVLYLLNVNENELPVPIDSLVGPETFVIVQNYIGDSIASRADVILPGAAPTEQSGWFVNFEGRAQRARNSLTPPLDARVDWKILRALSEVVGPVLPYSTDRELQDRLQDLVPTLAHRSEISRATPPGSLLGEAAYNKFVKAVLGKAEVYPTPFRPNVYDFFLEGHPAARTSQHMAACSREYYETTGKNNFRHIF